MENRRRRNLRRRRRQILFQRILWGIGIAVAIFAIFFCILNLLDTGILSSLRPGTAPTLPAAVDEYESQITVVIQDIDNQSKTLAETGNEQTETVQEQQTAVSEPLIVSGTGEMESAEASEAQTESQTEIQTKEDTELAQETESSEPAVVVVGSLPEPEYVSLVMVGDNLMHRSVSMSGLQLDGSYNYDYNFSKVAPIIQAADIAIINQETVIGGNELGIQGYPNFNGRTEMADALVRNGFDVILAANNHILDQGAQGTLYMYSYFKNVYPQITLLGIHDSWETRDQISVVEKNGIRIAMINYTDLLNIPSYYTGQEYLVDYLDYDRLAALIQTAKLMSDFVIVFPHWGTEYNLGTDEKQQQEVNFLAEQGVDLVIGTHPHVVEPVSYITRPDGKKMLVYYSLGNYQSIQNKEATMIGAMAHVTLKKTYAGVSISDFNMSFLANDYRMSGRFLDYYDIVTTYPWEQYSRDLALTSWVHHDNENFNVDYMFQLQAQMQAQVTAERQAAGLE